MSDRSWTHQAKPNPLLHPKLGQIQGRLNKGVVQYLGLRYATLEHRLAEPTLAISLDKLDATRHGPPVLTPPGSEQLEKHFIQMEIPGFEKPPMSDLHGLNLNVTVPLEGGHRLPVVVYVHGGGFVFGSGSYSHYDQSKVVELSSIMNQPIIAVNINYRLGIAGFLSSEELTAAGIPSNRGLLDMIVALGWLKTFISGFGGDPDNITAVGQSAGAASLCYLLGHEEPLFRQAVLLGGTFLMMRPRSTRQAEVLYGEIIDTLGLTSMSPNERLKALLSMPSDKLVPMTPDVVRLGPVIDNSVILQKPTFSNLGNNELILPGKTWCQKIYLVQSEFDGSIFDQVNLGLRPPGVGDAFRQHLEDSFGVKRAAIVIETYKLMGNIPDSLAVENITNLITDIMFLAPAIALSEAWVGRAVLGLFNEHNPWNGPYKGKANHLLDVALLWGNFNGVYEQKPWTVARALAESFVSFVNNKVDLPLFDQQERVTVFGPSDEDVSSTIVGLKDEKAKRSRDIFKLAANVGGLDALLDSVQSFLSS